MVGCVYITDVSGGVCMYIRRSSKLYAHNTRMIAKCMSPRLFFISTPVCTRVIPLTLIYCPSLPSNRYLRLILTPHLLSLPPSLSHSPLQLVDGSVWQYLRAASAQLSRHLKRLGLALACTSASACTHVQLNKIISIDCKAMCRHDMHKCALDL